MPLILSSSVKLKEQLEVKQMEEKLVEYKLEEKPAEKKVEEKKVVKELRELSPIEQELLDFIKKEKKITFFDLKLRDPRWMGALGRLTQRRLAEIGVDRTKGVPKEKRKFVAFVEVDKKEKK